MLAGAQYWTAELGTKLHVSTMANVRERFDDLKICHINCQSLVAHYDEFHNFFITSDYYVVVCMTETWLRGYGVREVIDIAIRALSCSEIESKSR